MGQPPPCPGYTVHLGTANATAWWLCRSEDDPEQNPIQDAVVRVFNRIVDSTNPGLEPAQVFMGRMLLLPPQVLSSQPIMVS